MPPTKLTRFVKRTELLHDLVMPICCNDGIKYTKSLAGQSAATDIQDSP